MTKETVLRTLSRAYYFAEAMALYDNYYRPLHQFYRPLKELESKPNRASDRDLTWVPLVFHCTSFSRFEKIISSGEVSPMKKPYVALSEIPIGELDRMKIRHNRDEQIAIGFPRRALQNHGFASVLYAQHHPMLQDLLKGLLDSDESLRDHLGPFIELEDDVSAFREIRTTDPIPIGDAVWLLSTKLDDEGKPVVPKLAEFTERFGGISVSYWHRTHQMAVLDEPQFISFETDENGSLNNCRFMGKHYFEIERPEPQSFVVDLPDDQYPMSFRSVGDLDSDAAPRPMYFIDVARTIIRKMVELGLDIEQTIPHQQIGLPLLKSEEPNDS